MSSNPTSMRFEKMISGLYLGELCRVTVLSPEVLPAFSKDFSASLASTFGERMSLPTSLMSQIEDDSSPQLTATAKALAAAGLPASTMRDRVLLREACVNISTRAARLAAVGVVSLLDQMNELDTPTTVAVDGTGARATHPFGASPILCCTRAFGRWLRPWARAHAPCTCDRPPATPPVPPLPCRRPRSLRVLSVL